MKEFLLLFRGGDAHRGEMSPELLQVHLQKWMGWMGRLKEQGKLLGAQPLANTGRTIAGTKKVLSDGPFMEGKEMLGGYLLCYAADYDEAVAIGMECPIFEFEDGNVEVRQVTDMNM